MSMRRPTGRDRRGGASLTTPATLSILDLTAQAASYAGLTYTRTGGAVSVQVSPSTVETKGNDVPLAENRQDGAGWGVWVFPSYANDVAAPHDLGDTGTWTAYLSPAIVRPASLPGVGPDGTTQVSTIEDASGAAIRGVYRNAATAPAWTATPNRFASIWIKDGSPAPGANKGTLGHAFPITGVTSFYQREYGATLGTGTDYRRVRIYTHGNTVASNLVLLPANGGGGNNRAAYTTTAFVDDATQQGKVFAGFAQSHTGPADLPFVSPSSAAGNVVGQIADPSSIVLSNGDVDLEVSFIADTDHAAVVSTSIPSVQTGHLFSAATPDGELSLRYVQGTGANSYWDRGFYLKVRGVDVLDNHSAATGSGIVQHGWKMGDIVRVRFWYRVSTGTSGIRYTVNGVRHHSDTTGVTSGVALAAATDAHLGSLSGTSSFFAARYRTLTRHNTPAGDWAPSIVMIGDSTSAPYLRDTATLSQVVLNSEEATKSTVLSVYGETLAQQATRWTNLQNKGGVRAVIIMCGFNDIQAGTATATILAAIQSQVNQIASDCPTAKIVVCQLHPAKAFWGGSAAKLTVWTDVNTGINGGGGTPITGAHAIVTGHVTPLDDGTYGGTAGNLAVRYASDTVHPNWWGRGLTATYIRSALQGLGVL